jgi:hypothetical protein
MSIPGSRGGGNVGEKQKRRGGRAVNESETLRGSKPEPRMRLCDVWDEA